MANPKTILVVEDEKSLRGVICDKIKQEGMQTLEAGDGQEGLEVAFEKHPDLILLDIVMPVMDGMSMLSELRKDSWGKNVPVILLTNLSDPEKMAEGIKDRSSGYLIKADWKLGDVVKKIKAELEPK